MKRFGDPDYGDGGGNIRTAFVLRTIMSSGAAIAITSFIGTSICIVHHPIDLNMCITMTDSILETITSAGFLPQAVGSLGGVVFYYLSGNWNTN